MLVIRSCCAEEVLHRLVACLQGQPQTPLRSEEEMATLQSAAKRFRKMAVCSFLEQILTHLKSLQEKKAKERVLQRFLFPLWTGEEQPAPKVLVGFLTIIRQLVPHRKRSSPLVLHCSSGGVGQMGMLIALDTLLQQTKGEKSVDVYGVVLRLVRSCCLMTPTLDKYMYLYECIRDTITQKQA